MSPTTRPMHRESLGTELRTIAVIMATFLALLWSIELVDANVLHGRLDSLGILPRTPRGLLGILAAPFLHGDWNHLLSNTIGIVMLGGLTLLVGRREFFTVTVAGVFIGGLGTWLVGRPSMHIGASGLVFAYFGYLLMRGWYDRRFGSMLLAGVVAWFYGGLLLGMVPGIAPAIISWECHLFGFVGGVVAARMLHQRA